MNSNGTRTKDQSLEPRVVLVHGCFDLLHVGHLAYFKKAKSLGDKLVVSVTSDRYVNKGPGRPYFSQEVRMRMVKAIAVVDEVILSDSPSAVGVIEQVKPRFYVKGADYMDMTKDPTGQIYLEEEAVKKHGGELVFTNEETESSSNLINRFFSQWSNEQQKVIKEVKDLGGMELIKAELDKVSALKASVIGELIWDTYRFVKPEGISSKSPSISSRFVREEKYQGGAWAITNHIKSFCHVDLISSDIEHEKTRYISEDTGQRMFEVTNIHKEEMLPVLWKQSDLCIFADFGHGLLDGTETTLSFKALNVQANSSNYGFNVFTKHKKWDYLVLDQRELRLAYNDRTTNALELGHRAHSINLMPVGLTMGPQGSIFYHKGQSYLCPAFTDSIVDTVGAGDAYLALTSLLVRVGTNPIIINFLGNVFAGLKTKIIGNKASVTKIALIKACEGILK